VVIPPSWGIPSHWHINPNQFGHDHTHLSKNKPCFDHGKLVGGFNPSEKY